MYLSKLTLNHRSRRAMTEVARPYELHRSIMRAFPVTKDGGPGRVLFRLDVSRENNGQDGGGGLTVLVQSEREPSWDRLAGVGDYVLDHASKPFEPRFKASQALFFRLRANPTKKIEEKRVGLYKEDEQTAWLTRKGTEGGFDILSVTIIPEGKKRDGMTDAKGVEHDMVFCSVMFEGVLRVTDAERFAETLAGGIGSAKGMGFGMLSVALLRG